jgi:TatD DNase family protein
MIIDTHCHLDNEQYQDDVDQVIKNAFDENIKAFIIPGADPKDLQKAILLSEKYDEVFFAVGVHPYDCDNFNIEFLEKYITHPKCVAVGECGLDYYRLPQDQIQRQNNISLQKEIFIQQINLAKKYKKPLIIHIRDASDDSKTILLENDAKQVGGVLHCFNASSHLLPLQDENFYFGIGGVVTFKNAKKLVQIIPQIPLDRIIIETDAPYLTPHPFRGTRNEPKYTNLVAQKLSKLLDLDINEIENITTNNAKALFKELNSII